jgi:hypothetical protein
MRLKLRYAILFWLVLLGCSAVYASPQTGVVKGKVRLQDSKTHEGVTILVAKAERASAKAGKIKEETREQSFSTNNKGEFEITSLAPGEYVFSFKKQGFKTFTSRKIEVPAGDTLNLRLIELKREGEPYAQLRGAVFYGVGFTLPNALVTIERIDGGKKFKQEKVSQEGGEFGFTLKAEKATYRITASAHGFLPASQEITIEGDELRNIALTLQPVK